MDLTNFFEELKQESVALAKQYFGDNYTQAQQQMSIYIESSKIKIQEWSIAAAQGELSWDELKSLLKGEKDLLHINTLQQIGSAQIDLENLKETFIDSIIDKLKNL